MVPLIFREIIMKIRYHRHSITNLIFNSIDEGIDAVIDNGYEIYSIAVTHSNIAFIPPSVKEYDNAPEIKGHKFVAWLSRIEDTTKRTRLYYPVEVES
jgi:hypothetical protein